MISQFRFNLIPDLWLTWAPALCRRPQTACRRWGVPPGRPGPYPGSSPQPALLMVETYIQPYLWLTWAHVRFTVHRRPVEGRAGHQGEQVLTQDPLPSQHYWLLKHISNPICDRPELLLCVTAHHCLWKVGRSIRENRFLLGFSPQPASLIVETYIQPYLWLTWAPAPCRRPQTACKRWGSSLGRTGPFPWFSPQPALLIVEAYIQPNVWLTWAPALCCCPQTACRRWGAPYARTGPTQDPLPSPHYSLLNHISNPIVADLSFCSVSPPITACRRWGAPPGRTGSYSDSLPSPHHWLLKHISNPICDWPELLLHVGAHKLPVKGGAHHLGEQALSHDSLPSPHYWLLKHISNPICDRPELLLCVVPHELPVEGGAHHQGEQALPKNPLPSPQY